MSKYYELVHKYTKQSTGKGQDESQEAFLQLLECAHTYDIEQNVPFESYYKMRLHYWFLNRIREKTELLVVDHDWSSGISMADLIESTIGNAQELIELSEVQEKLQQALSKLTLKQNRPSLCTMSTASP